MTTIFHGLNTAYTGLQAFQRSIETTSHNITNAETEGYSRQTAVLAADDPYTRSHAFFSGLQSGQVGSGVVVAAMQRSRDQFADRAVRLEFQKQGEANAHHTGLTQVESAFNEIDGEALTTLMAKFYDSWQELALHPDNLSVRTAVVEQAKDVSNQMNTLVNTIRRTQRDLDGQFVLIVGEVNKDLDQIAQLNKGIAESTASGDNPNDLLDKRDQLFDKLSQYANFQFTPIANGVVNVSLNGEAVVDGLSSRPLQTVFVPGTVHGDSPIVAGGTLNPADLVINGINIVSSPTLITIPRELMDAINLRTMQTGVAAEINDNGELRLSSSGDGTQTISVGVSGNGLAIGGLRNGLYQVTNGREVRLADGRNAQITSGELRGLTRTVREDVPAMLLSLDKLANTMISRVNGLHMSGYNLDKQTGVPFFVGTQAKDIAVGSTIQADVRLVAAATSPVSPPGDGNRALDIAALKNQPMMSGRTSEDFYNNLLTEVGYAVSLAGERQSNQGLIVKGLESRRQSVSGVSLDEEFSNLIRFQRAYQASAKMVSTFDELLDTIVNGLKR